MKNLVESAASVLFVGFMLFIVSGGMPLLIALESGSSGVAEPAHGWVAPVADYTVRFTLRFWGYSLGVGLLYLAYWFDSVKQARLPAMLALMLFPLFLVVAWATV